MIINKIQTALPDGLKLLYQSKKLDPKSKLEEVAGLKSDEVIYAVSNKQLPDPRRSRSPAVFDVRRQMSQINIQQNRSNRTQPYPPRPRPPPNRAYGRMNNCNILHRNIDACIEASVRSMNPSDRVRHNDPVSATPADPTAVDLGQHVLQMASSIRSWALELNKLSDFLVRDDDFIDAADRERTRRLIQNNMDTARYFHPYLQNFTAFSIPLISPAPRRLVVQEGQRPPQSQNQTTNN